MTIPNLFAAVAPPVVSEPAPQELDRYTDEHGETFTVLNVLDWKEMPKELSTEQAEQIMSILGAEKDAIKRYEENTAKLVKKRRGFFDWVYLQMNQLLLSYGQTNVKRYSRGANKGQPKEKYVQLSNGRILLGKTGGVGIFDGVMYQAWLKKQKRQDLIAWGATVTIECDYSKLSEFDLEMLNRVGKVELHLGDNLERIMLGVKGDDGKWLTEPVKVEGATLVPVNEVGKLRGIE